MGIYGSFEDRPIAAADSFQSMVNVSIYITFTVRNAKLAADNTVEPEPASSLSETQ